MTAAQAFHYDAAAKAIERDANTAAQRAVIHGVEQINPWFPGSDAAVQWQADYLRFLLQHSARGVDA